MKSRAYPTDDLGFIFDDTDRLSGGEPDWHYVKDLAGLTEEKDTKSFIKNGKATVKRANTFLKRRTKNEPKTRCA